jgi:AcrR family transcriptional regulator
MGIKERRKREKEMRRRQIVTAAKHVFLHKGLKSATIEDIATEAELGVATLYSYFKNKDELYAALNLITLEYIIDQVEIVYVNDSLSIEQKIIKFKDAMYKSFRFDPKLLRNIFRVQLEENLTSLSRELLEQINQLTRKILTMWADTFDEGVKQGIFLPRRRMLFVDIMWSIFAGLVIWEGAKTEINPEKDFLKSSLDEAFEIFLRGIKTDKAPNGDKSEWIKK